MRTWIGFVILLVLAGCATDGKIKPEEVSQEPSMTKGPSVTQLEGGRKGFIITEVPQMEEDSRKDFERAVTLLKDQEYEKAVDILEKIIEKSPGVTAPYIDIAIAYQHIDKPEKAEEHLKVALQLVPDHPVASNVYGLLCRKAGRFEEARGIYEKAITSFPDYYPVHRNLGILCDFYLNDPVCALDHYEIYSEAMPEDKQVKLWIADLRARLGRN
ncbi:MAG: tetratricopeptide repeat protein [Deltaproteobacteria bacterium]|nr:tetratricopeptide repeat protein [Deltaproteobacteria bacterium]